MRLHLCRKQLRAGLSEMETCTADSPSSPLNFSLLLCKTLCLLRLAFSTRKAPAAATCARQTTRCQMGLWPDALCPLYCERQTTLRKSRQSHCTAVSRESRACGQAASCRCGPRPQDPAAFPAGPGALAAGTVLHLINSDALTTHTTQQPLSQPQRPPRQSQPRDLGF